MKKKIARIIRQDKTDQRMKEIMELERQTEQEKNSAQPLMCKVTILLQAEKFTEAREILDHIRNELFYQLKTDEDLRNYMGLVEQIKSHEQAVINNNNGLKPLLNRLKLLIADQKLQQARLIVSHILTNEIVPTEMVNELEGYIHKLKDGESYKTKYETLLSKYQELQATYQHSPPGEAVHEERQLLTNLIAYIYITNSGILNTLSKRIQFEIQQIQDVNQNFNAMEVTNIAEIVDKHFNELLPLLKNSIEIKI